MHPRLLVSSLLILSVLTVRVRAEAGEHADEKVFVGYLFGSPKNLNFALYTHLCHAFVTANADGKIRENRQVPNLDLTRQAHDQGVKVLISLGGWGWDEQFASIAAHQDAENRYVQGVMDLVDRFDYDGLDLDWEYPDTEAEARGFQTLARRFRKELDSLSKTKNRPMLFTMAVSSNPGTLKWLDKATLLETMDWLNVMTYDYAGPWSEDAGHHSPLYASSKTSKSRSTEASMKYLVETQGLPPGRLAVGLPLYGRGFSVSEPYASTRNAPKARVPESSFRGVEALRTEKGWTRQWDDETKNPWLVAPDRSMVIGYDDPESARIKTEWAMKQGFRGVFFWQVDGDRLPDGTNPVQKAAHEVWKAAQVK